MKTQTPLYRAKKIDNEEYVIGFYTYDEVHKRHLILTNRMHGLSETRVDSSTLSIHLPDMLAGSSNRLLPNGEKDLRIFASLNEDGKGGDEVTTKDYSSIKSVVVYDKGCFNVIGITRVSVRVCSYGEQRIKITGIKQ